MFLFLFSQANDEFEFCKTNPQLRLRNLFETYELNISIVVDKKRKRYIDLKSDVRRIKEPLIIYTFLKKKKRLVSFTPKIYNFDFIE